MQWSSITAVSHLVAVGAGAGDVLAQCITCKPANTLVYEADAAQAQLLAGEYQQSPAFTVKPLAVAVTTTTSQLHRFNLPQCNALSAATAELNAIFPGLQALPVKELQTVELAAELVSAKVQGQNNMLLLELPAQNLSLLQHLADKQLLAHFSHLVIQHSEQVLYQGGATLAQVQQFLAEQGFEQQELDSSDADFPLLRFYRDAKAEQLKQTQQQLQQTEQQKAELAKQLELAKQQATAEKQQSEQHKAEQAKQLEVAKQQAEQQKAELAKQLEAAKQQAEQQKAELTKQLEVVKQQAEQHKAELAKQLEVAKQQGEQQKAELAKQLDAVKQQAEQQKAELAKQLETAKQQAEQQKADLTKQLDAVQQQATAEKLQAEQQKAELAKQLEAANQQAEQQKAELAKQLEANQQQLFGLVEQKIQQLLVDQTTKLVSEVQNAKNSLSWVIGNSAKQVESFIAIQNYLEKGIKPLSFHGWPISPDIGLYITGLIDENNYDVIIEFGSGTSTVLMAKALQAKQRGVERKGITDKQVKSQASTPLAFEDYTDLPARIVSFEHNNKYHAQTLQAIKNNGVDYLVNLVHAPLVEYQYKDGTEYLYYSCTETLQYIAKIFKGRKANILVLVDGPPGSTNKNARFPCLPHLLKVLPSHSYTIVMDDYGRAEEKETTELWRKILEERSYSVSVETIANEKGLAILKVD